MTTMHCPDCTTLREQLAATQRELVSQLVEKMPLTVDAQHAYESGLMARAERAEAERDSFDADNKRLTERLHHAQAERDKARAAVQAACDAAVTAACSAVESERDAVYAQRNLANEQLLDAMDREQKARIEAAGFVMRCNAPRHGGSARQQRRWPGRFRTSTSQTRTLCAPPSHHPTLASGCASGTHA